MQITAEEARALRHRPLFNLLSQIIMSVGQPMPRYYLQRLDGSMINVMDYLQEPDGSMTYSQDAGSGCAGYVSRMLTLTAPDPKNASRLIDGPHGTVASTVKGLQATGWQEIDPGERPKPGDVIIWEKQRQADGEHVHIGFSLGNHEAVSTNYVALAVSRHADNRNARNEPRAIERLLRYPWPEDEYKALAHLDLADGSAC